MSSDTNKKDVRRFTGWHFLISIVGFFAVVISANMIMAYFAIDTFPGLETEDAYRKGRDYNDILAAAQRQEALGWQESISLEKTGSGTGAAHHLKLVLAGAEDESGLKVQLLLKRPATDADDQLLALVETTAGTFEAVTSELMQGRWKASLLVEKQGQQLFHKNMEFMVREQ